MKDVVYELCPQLSSVSSGSFHRLKVKDIQNIRPLALDKHHVQWLPYFPYSIDVFCTFISSLFCFRTGTRGTDGCFRWEARTHLSPSAPK